MSGSQADIFEFNDDPERSMFLRSLIESANLGPMERPPHLPDIGKPAVDKVVEYLEYHRGDPMLAQERLDDEVAQTGNEPYAEWDTAFAASMSNKLLFDVIIAANFLNVKPLLSLGTKQVASMIRGKRPDEIRDLFSVYAANNFTPEEQAQIRRENGRME